MYSFHFLLAYFSFSFGLIDHNLIELSNRLGGGCGWQEYIFFIKKTPVSDVKYKHSY